MVKLTVPVSPAGPGGSPAPPRGASGRGPGGGLRDPPSPFPPLAVPSPSWPLPPLRPPAGPGPSVLAARGRAARVVVLAGEPVVLAGEQGVEGRLVSRARNTRARSCSRVPPAPAFFRSRAAVSMCWSAASTAAGGRSRPASDQVPAGSVQHSTRASFCAFSRRLRAASGSRASTARCSTPRSCPVVSPGASAATSAATAAASTSPRPASSLGEDDRFRQVDPPGRQRRGHGRQPGDRGGEADQPVRRPAGQRQGRGDLITDVIARAQVTGRAASAARREPSPADRGQLQRGGPRRQPPRRGTAPRSAHHRPARPARHRSRRRRPGQHRAGTHLIELTAGREPPGTVLAVVPGAPGHQRLPHRRRPGSLRQARRGRLRRRADRPAGGMEGGSGGADGRSGGAGKTPGVAGGVSGGTGGITGGGSEGTGGRSEGSGGKSGSSGIGPPSRLASVTC